EVREAFDGDERLVRAAVLRYGLDDPQSGMHTDHDRHVLYLANDARTVAERLELDAAEAESILDRIATRLKEARDARPRPYVDETVYAGWTALVASGHIAAARYLGLEEAGAAGLRALERIMTEAFHPDVGVAHRVGDTGGEGYLEDQA